MSDPNLEVAIDEVVADGDIDTGAELGDALTAELRRLITGGPAGGRADHVERIARSIHAELRRQGVTP